MPEPSSEKIRSTSFEHPAAPLPEKRYEQDAERPELPRTEPLRPSQKSPSRAAVQRGAAVQAPRIDDPELKDIENILSENMDHFFLSLSPQKQVEFKQTGEATAVKIKHALHEKKVRIKEIVRLIVAWLKTLPGINRFFLEQEAKIKADKIMQRHHS